VFNFKGPWTASGPYVANDVVTEGGTSYVALVASSGVDPATDVTNNAGNWAVLALAGAQGPQGPTGPSGTTGLFGHTAYGTTLISGTDPSCVIGEVKLFAGAAYPSSWAPASGQLLQIVQYQALFSLFGTIYGGDGVSTFALPNLTSVTPDQSTGYFVCLEGTFP
jgi:hypothetical protein